MRILLFIALWAICTPPSLHAQKVSDVWAALEHYVAQREGQAIPNETLYLTTSRTDDYLERSSKVTESHALLPDTDRRQQIRRDYWSHQFAQQNREHFSAAKDDYREQFAGLRNGNNVVPNPPLVNNCNINIVIIVDRSGSIMGNEMPQIRMGLNNFINNQVGTGNTVSFIGMSSTGVAPAGPSTVTYNTGIGTGLHSTWIGQLNGNGNRDQWSLSLTLAATLNPDLVIIIADGDDSHGNTEAAAVCTAANALKNAGAHLFVFGQIGGTYESGSLLAAVSNAVDPNPVAATNPPNNNNLANDDFIGFPLQSFAPLGNWLSILTPGTGSVNLTAIDNRSCITHATSIRGLYQLCPGQVAASIQLEFFQNGSLVTSVNVTNFGNGSFRYDTFHGDLLALGLNPGEWYDVVPVLNLTSGTVIRGTDFQVGNNNDLRLAGFSDPQVIVNDALNDRSTEMYTFCEGQPIYYHGTDPTSSNHFTDIERRPIGGSTWGDYRQQGWVGASLDNFDDNLLNYYPASYFAAGFEYRLKIATNNSDPNVCVAWTETFVFFEVVDCCQPEYTLHNIPDCTREGEAFTIEVRFDRPLTAADIERIYSTDNNFTYLSHQVVRDGSITRLFITFVPETCDCEGKMLVFDIILRDCLPNNLIWIMTDPIPCCADNCEFIAIDDWTAGECVIVNGQPGRPFSITVGSPVPILAASAASNNATCQVTLLNLAVQALTPTKYQITGFLRFSNTQCMSNALVSLLLQTDMDCCRIDQGFSFPTGCELPAGCLGAAAASISQIDMTRNRLEIAIPGLPPFDPVTVINHLTGQVSTATGTFIICSSPGSQFPRICEGIQISVPSSLDCRPVEGMQPSIPYYYEIQYEGCKWLLIGDYCDHPFVYPEGGDSNGDAGGEGGDQGEGGGDTGGGPIGLNGETDATRLIQARETGAAEGQVRIYPNPLPAGQALQFDLTGLDQAVDNIQVLSPQGKLMEAIQPPVGVSHFRHDLRQQLVSGLYFVRLRMADGSLRSQRLLLID
ncbi:MAG: T9SS type A sorting domain-containing protein [Bacteroidota bacterium]